MLRGRTQHKRSQSYRDQDGHNRRWPISTGSTWKRAYPQIFEPHFRCRCTRGTVVGMRKTAADGGQIPMTEPDANTVLLRGRISGVEELRELPSGDKVRTLRLVVPRPAGRGRPASVDTIDVACWSAATRRVLDRVGVGDTIAVSGSLRRRFFRAGGAVASRYEVEASSLQRLVGAAD